METSGGAWHPDPAGRHRARWYDGTRWTDWVNDGREAFRDPHGAAPAGVARSPATAGWFTDPTGRYPGRYHDGRRWTEWVSTGGEPLRDPAGAPGVARPTAAHDHRAGATGSGRSGTRSGTRPARAAASSSGLHGFWGQLAEIGPDIRRRPAPTLWTALGGAGGALAAVGIVLILGGESANNAGRAIAGAALVAVGLFSGHVPSAPREARAAGTAAAAVGIGATALALAGVILPDDGNPRIAALPLLLAAAAYLVVWWRSPLRGRPVIIALGVLASLAAVAVLVGGGSAIVLSTVLLLCAGGLLAFVVTADRRGLVGIGTTAIVAALVATWAGLAVAAAAATGEWSFAGDEECLALGTCAPSNTPLLVTGLLAFCVGIVVGYVGSSGGRRASTWYGAITSAGGLTSFLLAAFQPAGAVAGGAVIVVAGGLLIATAALVRRLRSDVTT